MSTLKKILLSGLSLTLVAVIAITGTVAYLTDRDSEVNTFTVGDVAIDLNEEFEQGAELIPGVKINKNAEITNVGENDAWVWLTALLPKELGPYTAPDNLSASNNVVHWNYPKANAENISMKFESIPVTLDPDGDGVESDYYRTSLLYNKVLAPEAATGIMLSTVYMDTHIDIDPNGDWYWVKDGGEAIKLDWNENTNGLPKLYVSAYAIQANEFDTVEDAYTAYNNQWGDNGTEYNNSVTVVSTFEDIKTAFAKGGTVILANDIVFEEPIVMNNGENVVLNMNGKTITPVGTKADPFFDTYPGTTLVITGNGTFDLGNNPSMSILMPGGDVTIKNGTFLKGRSDNVNGPMIAAYARAEGKFIIEGGYFDSGYYKEGDCFNNCRNGVNLTWGNTYRIYGGTFVGQNPAWGDEGRAVLCPHCENNGSNCQGVFLEGQTTTSTELPEGYTITEGTSADGRPTYTVNYSK